MERWVKIAELAQLKPDRGLPFEIDGHRIALFLHEDKPYAIDDHCPHAGGPLSAGYSQGGLVMCPWHGWRFRVTDGVWVDAPQAGLCVRSYPVQCREGDIYVDLHAEPKRSAGNG